MAGRKETTTPPPQKSLLNTLWQPTHSLLSVWRWRMPEPPPSSLSFQPHPANTETTNRSPTAFKALARYICQGPAQAAFTSHQEASAEARSDAPWVTASLGQSRRGPRQPQSAHSDLNKERVTFFWFTCAHFYGRMSQTQTCHKALCFHSWSSDFYTHPI